MSGNLADALRRLLESGLNDEAAERELCSALEWSIPGRLKELHNVWKYETLDGVLPIRVTPVGNTGLELFGRCILLSDQTLVPILVTLNLEPTGTVTVSGFIGEPDEESGGMRRVKYGSQEAEKQYKSFLGMRPTRWFSQF